MYYTVCPHCGASLDPGERCDCQQHKYITLDTERTRDIRTVQEKEGQLRWVLDEELQAS